ncbi:MAG: hypothetical protein RID91_19705 [Azospirillaceae bacterium]
MTVSIARVLARPRIAIAGVLLAIAGSGPAAGLVGPASAAAQDGTTVGALLGQYERLPEAHPGRVIIESAVGNYALGMVDHARRRTAECGYYAETVLSADGLFLAWRDQVIGDPEAAGLETEWRRAVRHWVDGRCAQ